VLRLTQPQLSLADAWLAPELCKLPEELAVVDRWLDDERFMAPYVERFDQRIGRPTIPVERYQRLMYLKFRYKFGYEALVSEVSDSIHWRLFCRIPLNEKVPHSTTLSKLTRKYGPEIVEELNGLLVGKMVEEKLVRGRKAQMDTTAVEANIEHPTDANLLEDGIRYIDRCVKKLGQAVEGAAKGFRSGARKAKQILFGIGATLKSRATRANAEQSAASAATPAAPEVEAKGDLQQDSKKAGSRVPQALQEVVRAGVAAVRQAGAAVKAAASKASSAAKEVGKKVSAKREKIDELTAQMAQVAEQAVRHGWKVLAKVHEEAQGLSKAAGQRLQAMTGRLEDALEVTQRVLEQTALRLQGVRSIPDRLVSILDREARAICRGKLGRSIEFGYKVLITEVEKGIVAAYKVLKGNPADVTLALPALDQLKKLFGRAPREVAADKGFSSAENERKMKRRGVKRVAIPQKGKRSKHRDKIERASWFRRLQRWRAGGEATIGRFKRSYGLDCSYLLGYDGTATWVGFSFFTGNLHRIKRLVSAAEVNQGSGKSKPGGPVHATVALPAAS